MNHDDVDWTNISTFQCEDCMSGKSRKHNHIVGSRTKYQEVYAPFQYLHSDIFGSVNLPGIMEKYFITFTDESTRFRWVFFLVDHQAHTVIAILRKLIKSIDTQFDAKVRCFQFDRGKEYFSEAVRNYLENLGIDHIYTTVGDSKAHGVAERLNLTLLNDCRTLLRATSLPETLWSYAIKFSVIIRNSTYSESLGASPRSKSGLRGLDASSILPFGQSVIVHLHRTLSKLHYRGKQRMAFCPSPLSCGYYIHNYRRIRIWTRFFLQ